MKKVKTFRINSRLFFILLFIIISGLCLAQNKEPGNTSNVINSVSNDTLKMQEVFRCHSLNQSELHQSELRYEKFIIKSPVEMKLAPEERMQMNKANEKILVKSIENNLEKETGNKNEPPK